MTYNSEQPDLIIPEYGRNVQQMIDFCKTVADREERNKVASAIISVMGQLCPYLRDIDDFKHKLWDHLHIMAKFELDVDGPYPMPEKEQFEQKPEMLSYPDGDFKYSHYGKSLERLIKKISDFDEGEEKEQATLVIANLMKKHYVSWNHNSVDDEVVIRQLTELSKGKMKLKEGQTLAAYVEPVHRPNPKKKKPIKRKKR
jgi:hypothetical protein